MDKKGNIFESKHIKKNRQEQEVFKGTNGS